MPGVDSALWNLTINSNGVFVELYEELVWEIAQSRGMGAAAAVLDANRALLVGNPAPFSKNLHTWTEELHDRRAGLSDATNPNPFPSFHHHSFAKSISGPETYYYIDPARCSLTTVPARVGQITVTP